MRCPHTRQPIAARYAAAMSDELEHAWAAVHAATDVADAATAGLTNLTTDDTVLSASSLSEPPCIAGDVWSSPTGLGTP
jgi:hypothetical protein